MECVYLEDAEYVGGFRIFLRFNDGRSGEVDLKETVHKHAVAAPLREPAAFSQFHLDSWPTLAWDCGFDVAPEALYEKCDRDNLFPSRERDSHLTGSRVPASSGDRVLGESAASE